MAITVNSDAKLRFLRGLEANLPTEKVDGYVYVTTDTRAMYVDYKNTDGILTRIRIGDVLTVANIAALPAIASAQPGILYYCTAENILCTPVGGEWKQINKQQTMQTIIDNIQFTAADTTTGATMTVKLNGGDKSVKQASLNINESANVKVNVANNAVTIGAKDTTITGAISVANSDSDATIALTNTTGGTDALGKALTGTASGGTVKIVGSGAKVTANAGTITVNSKQSIANAFDESGNFTTKLTYADNTTTTSAAIAPIINYGANSSAKFANGTATLNVYTKAETDNAINEKLKTANAMTFKGTMGSTGATVTKLPVSASLGDTYVVVERASYSYTKAGATQALSQLCMVGDMFIAGPGEEGTDGLLKSLCWTYVPAGNDDLPVASATASNTEIAFKSTLSGQTTTVGTVKVGSGITGAASGTALTLSHSAIATTKTDGTKVTQSKGNNATYTAITGVTINNGHVTGYETTQFTVTDTTLAAAGLAVAAATGGASVTLSVKDTANKSFGNAINITASGNSASYVSTTTNGVVIDTVWGSF